MRRIVLLYKNIQINHQYVEVFKSSNHMANKKQMCISIYKSAQLVPPEKEPFLEIFFQTSQLIVIHLIYVML